jgi:hypothetical protein
VLRAHVARLIGEHALVLIDRRTWLAELDLVQVAELEHHVDALLTFGVIEVAGEQRGQLAVLLHALVQALERAARHGVRRVERQDLLVGLDRALRPIEDLLEQEAQLREQLELGLRVERLFDPLAVQDLQVVPALAARVQLFERDERALVLRVGGEHALMQGLGVLGQAEDLVEQLRSAHGQLEPGFLADVAGFDRRAVCAAERALLARRFCRVGQAIPQLAVARLLEEGRFERAVRARGIAELAGADLRDAQAQAAHLVLVLLGLEPLLEQLEQLVVATGALVHHLERRPDARAELFVLLADALERGDRAGVRAFELEHALERADRALGLHELVEEQEAQARAELDLLGLVAFDRDPPLDHVGELFVAIGRERQPVEAGERLAIIGAQLAQRAQARRRAVGVAADGLFDLRELAQRRDADAFVGHVLQAVLEQRVQRHHVLRTTIDALERAHHLGVFRALREHEAQLLGGDRGLTEIAERDARRAPA